MTKCKHDAINSSQHVDPETVYKNLGDLPMEVLIMIYKDFELNDLLNVAKTHPHNHAAVEMVFYDKYRNASFKIGGNSPIHFHRINKEVMIAGHDWTVFVLKSFGHLISRLSINFNSMTELEGQEMIELVSNYCQTLEHIELVSCKGNELSHFQRPFTKVKKLQFTVGLLDAHTVNLSRIFPVVESITKASTAFFDYRCFEYNFPHLEHMDLDLILTRFPSKVETMLQLNPQLRSVSMMKCDMEMLRMLHQYVPSLEVIKIIYFSDFAKFAGEPVHFPHLKVLKFGSNYMQQRFDRAPVIATTLEEFEYGGPAISWLDFLQQNIQLKKLEIGEIYDEQFSLLLEKLDNLEELSVKYDILSVDKVLNCIEKATKLRKVSFGKISFDASKKIIDGLGSIWRMTVGYDAESVFEKKDELIRARLDLSFSIS